MTVALERAADGPQQIQPDPETGLLKARWTYDQYHRELAAIARKLGNPDTPTGKKGKLLYRQQVVMGQIPAVADRIDSLLPLCN